MIDESPYFVSDSSRISVFKFEKMEKDGATIWIESTCSSIWANGIQLIFLFQALHILCFGVCMCVYIVLNIYAICMMDFIFILKHFGVLPLLWFDWKIEQSGVSNCQSPSDLKSDFKQVLNSIYLDFYHNVMIHNILDVRIYRNCWGIFSAPPGNRITIETFATA